MAGTGIGTFDDRLRDAVRGGGAFSGVQEQGLATGLADDLNGSHQGSAADVRGRLAWYEDLARVGLAGGLRDFRFVNAAGREISGSRGAVPRQARGLHPGPAGARRLRLGPRQRDALRRHPVEGAALHADGRSGAHERPRPLLRRAVAGRALLPRGRRHAPLEVPRPEQLRLGRLVERPRLHLLPDGLGRGSASRGEREKLEEHAPPSREPRPRARAAPRARGGRRLSRDASDSPQLPPLPPADRGGRAEAPVLSESGFGGRARV